MKIWPSIEKSYHKRKDGYYQEVIREFDGHKVVKYTK